MGPTGVSWTERWEGGGGGGGGKIAVVVVVFRSITIVTMQDMN